ncbi:DUF3405 domain-containing protein [Cyclobacterium sp.]|uniref:DUF3405 domain-containing protein n=1 Tax=Cyclobacterium sp. TaxID=1966343 RepID=UPI0019AC07D2|nr:DUF3405 domain-containing protein [Cyclobacterium sp.]MBD3628545.1 DUF3405 domain-containing protein [Cyclobacterium sp.]
MVVKNSQSFLILSNKTSLPLIQKYREIFEATRDTGDTVLLYHLDKGKPGVNASGLNAFTFTDEVLSSLNYFPLAFTLVPGSNHFPLLKFYLSHPQYDYYWCIEDDVAFSGDWGAFFEAFSSLDTDFISSHIRRYKEEPEWPWWPALAHPYTVIPQEQRIRSFNPIYRISRQALELIHKALLSKWCGHHEVLIPTLLYESGLSIHDFGGKGEFVPEGFENRFYLDNSPNNRGILSDGTMRWRPVFAETGTLKNKLYHPVKLTDD